MKVDDVIPAFVKLSYERGDLFSNTGHKANSRFLMVLKYYLLFLYDFIKTNHGIND